jgi:hypothetical protein
MSELWVKGSADVGWLKFSCGTQLDIFFRREGVGVEFTKVRKVQ